MIEENIENVRKRVIAACGRSQRDPSSVTIVAAVKNRSTAELIRAFEAGIADFGESRLQEAKEH